MRLRIPIRRWATGGSVTVLAALALTAGAQAAAPAVQTTATPAPTTSDPYSPAYQHAYRRGVVPTVPEAAKMRSWSAQHAAAPALSASNLRYGGGIDGIGVTTGAERVYLVFDGSQWGTQGTDADGNLTLSGDPAGEAPYLQQMFKGLGTNGDLWSGVMTQYCDGVAAGVQTCPSSSTEHVAYPTGVALAGVWADEGTASPGQATAFQLGTEAVNAAAHFGNTTAAANRDAQYVIVSPTGTHPDGFNTTAGQFCAWHDWNGDSSVGATSPYGDIAFTNSPYVTDAGGACGTGFVNAGSAGAKDGISIVEGHEYAETITDQNPAGGWTDASGGENADKCAWIAPGTSGGVADLSLATGTFAMQSTWANDAAGGSGACEFSHPIVANGG
jgi:hypothetical protein